MASPNHGSEDSSDDNLHMNIDTTDSDDDYQPAEDDDIPIPPPLPVPPRATVHTAGTGAHHDRSFADYLLSDRFRRFVHNYNVSSVHNLEHHDPQTLESGGKIFLPPSALQQLSRNSSSLMSPMLFKATNPSTSKSTHCGVLEFIADEGFCYMPSWMMRILGVTDGHEIRIERVELPTASFAKFQPQSVDFLEITNPKAILENCLRYFACLTKGDMIAIHYNSRIYELCVLELEPANAVTIIECDMNVDFAPPVDYVSPSSSQNEVEEDASMDSSSPQSHFTAFTGSGNRLNGKAVEVTPSARKKLNVRGMPDTEWELGVLEFKRRFQKKPNHNDPSGKKDDGSGGSGTAKRRNAITPFGGAGLSLKHFRRSNNADENVDPSLT